MCPALYCSSVLPLPFAFSRTGILLGLVTMLVVGFCNAHTCMLLLRAAGSTGHDSYEGVAEAIGGRTWKVGCTMACMYDMYVLSTSFLPPSFIESPMYNA